MDKKQLLELADNIFEEAQDDWRGIWIIPQQLEQNYHVTDPSLRRALSLEIIRNLLHKGLVPGGFINHRPSEKTNTPNTTTADWQDWRDSNNAYHKGDEIIERINREWTALGRDPDIGEIVWFRKPDSRPKRDALNNPTPKL